MKFLWKLFGDQIHSGLKPVNAMPPYSSDSFIDVKANIDTPGSRPAVSLPLLLYSSSKFAPTGVLSRALWQSLITEPQLH